MSKENIEILVKPTGRALSVFDETIAKKLRNQYKLDDIDKSNQKVTVKFDHKLDAVGSSFVNVLFGPSLDNLVSKKKFFEKYTIEGDDVIKDSVLGDIIHLATRKGIE